jgi:hypothetical protein
MPPTRLILHALVAAAITVAPAIVAAAEDAEFAIRWDPKSGGPGSLEEVIALLDMQDPKVKAFQVEYFAIQQASKPPAGYAVIGRERIVGNETEATYKIRGPAPLAAELQGWVCPLKGGQSKREVDVTWTGAASPRRSISLSCSVDGSRLSPLLPADSTATSKKCVSKMDRRKKGDLTVEMWTLKGKVVFEVSLKAKDTTGDLQAFRDRVVAPLLEKKARPINESKTELGSQC